MIYWLRKTFCRGHYLFTTDGVAYYLHFGLFGGIAVSSRPDQIEKEPLRAVK